MKFNEIHGLGLYNVIYEIWNPGCHKQLPFGNGNDQSTHKYDDDVGMVFSWVYHFN